jgi:hypothetical protein
MLTKKERELLRDTEARLKTPWAGVGDYSTVAGLVQIINVQGKALGRAKTLVEKLDNIRVQSPTYAIDGGNFGPRPYDQELDALRAALCRIDPDK